MGAMFRMIYTAAEGFPNILIISWHNLPDFTVEIPFYGSITREVFSKAKCFLSKLAYSSDLYLFTRNRLSYSLRCKRYSGEIPTVSWTPSMYYAMDLEKEFNEFLEIFRECILPRMTYLKLPKL